MIDSDHAEAATVFEIYIAVKSTDEAILYILHVCYIPKKDDDTKENTTRITLVYLPLKINIVITLI